MLKTTPTRPLDGGAAVKLNGGLKGCVGATRLGVGTRESHVRWHYTIPPTPTKYHPQRDIQR